MSSYVHVHQIKHSIAVTRVWSSYWLLLGYSLHNSLLSSDSTSLTHQCQSQDHPTNMCIKLELIPMFFTKPTWLSQRAKISNVINLKNTHLAWSCLPMGSFTKRRALLPQKVHKDGILIVQPSDMWPRSQLDLSLLVHWHPTSPPLMAFLTSSHQNTIVCPLRWVLLVSYQT